MDQPQTDIVAQAIAGDGVALKLLLAETYEQVRRQIAGRIPLAFRSLLDAEDVLQDAHIEVFRRIRTFEQRGPDSFYRWLATIALSRLRNTIKALRTAKRGGGIAAVAPGRPSIEDSTVALLDLLAGPAETPSRSFARKEVLAAMQAGLNALPPQYRQAISLVHIEGWPVQEAAEKMARTERAVHGLCRRGLKVLRLQLESESRFFSTTG